eukprot:12421524-Karenia_brevis.AAC.1
MHGAENRKAIPKGEIPSEMWRTRLVPQWLKPNYNFKWGLGSDKRFPGIPKWHGRMNHLFDTVHATKCLPISLVVNCGFHVPKKYIASEDP